MTEPIDAVWVRVHPSNPRAKDFPATGWVSAEDWAYRDASRLFMEVEVHFYKYTEKFPVIILQKMQ